MATMYTGLWFVTYFIQDHLQVMPNTIVEMSSPYNFPFQRGSDKKIFS